MHTLSVLHKLLTKSVSIHAIRLNALMAAVHALTQGAKAQITSLGRNLVGNAYDKHKIKRMDRLISNPHLYKERHSIYTVLTQNLLSGLPEPIILIDWSPLCADQSWQLLRAALPVGGRTITLYEEVHPQSKLGNRKIQHQFLAKLATMIPTTARPIIVADAGFKTPFYRYIEETLGWHWIGRIRGRDFICENNGLEQWFGAKLLYQKATTTAKTLGKIKWVKSNPLAAFIVLIRSPKKKRKVVTYAGKERQSARDKVHAKRANEPWLLVVSLSLHERTPKQIVKLFRTRMQIEEGFRDSKAVHYGLNLSQKRNMCERRRSILCLLASLTQFILWCIGTAGKQSPIAKQVRVNSSSKREPYSVIFLARLLLRQKKFQLLEMEIFSSLKTIKSYMESVLCA